jgi:hypothetical protein
VRKKAAAPIAACRLLGWAKPLSNRQHYKKRVQASNRVP